MMKKLFTFLSLLTIALTISTQTRASHIVGMDLTYQYTGNPNEYLVSLKFYRDCAGITPGTQVSVCYISASLGVQGTFVMPLTSGPTVILTPPCLPNTGPNSCQGGSGYGVEEYVYSATMLLPQAAIDWKFIYTDCCRNNQITTLTNPAGEGIYIEALCNNLNFPTNSSPYFNQIPVTQFCVCNQFYFDNKAIDIDGDSLMYQLIDCQTGGGCPGNPTSVNYKPGFTGLTPITVCTNGAPTSIGTNSGIISMIPGIPEIAVLCVFVEEFDPATGAKKGHVRRDIQINISGNCIIQNPQFNTGTINGVDEAIEAHCLDTFVIITLTTPVQCGSVVPNGSDFRALRPNGSPNPIFQAEGINCVNGLTDSVKVYFYKPLTQGTTKLWTKLGADYNTLLTECGTPVPEYDTVNIVVVDTTNEILKFPDSVACVFNEILLDFPGKIFCYSIAGDGSDFILKDAVGTFFPIASATGIGCSPFMEYTNQIKIVTANPVSGIPPYYVVFGPGTDGHTISNECDKFYNIGDTVAIISTFNNIPIALGTDLTQCTTDPAPVLDAGNFGAFFTYQWYLNGTLLSDTTQTITASQPGTYVAIVGTGPTCNGSDTVLVNFLSAPNSPNLADFTICPVDVYPTWDAGSPGSTYQWFFNGTVVATTQTYQPSAPGTYVVQLSNTNCNTLDTASITIQPDVAVNLGSDPTICNDGSTILDAGNPGYSYAWTLNGNSVGGNTQTITATSPGTYIAQVTSPGGCKGADTSIVIIEAPLAAPVVVCAAAGNTQYPFIYEWAPITGATGYEVQIDGGPWVTPNAPTGAESHGTATPATSVIVHALGTIGCKGDNSEPAFCSIIIPNIVTPNGDALNDVFEITNLEQYTNAKLQLYNRWGNQIYSSDSYDNKYSFNDQPDGVYYYILVVPNSDPYTGNITVIRDKK